MNRRRALRAAAGVLGAAGIPAWARAAALDAAPDDRVLVIVELSGGNDGLNSVVPYGDDAYYRHRPTIGIPADRLLKLDDHFGLNPGMLGFHRLWETDDLAIVHGAGYDNPSYSHFTSMAYWHTATPNGGNEFGWAGRLADAMAPQITPNMIINIDSAQSLAVKSKVHTPVVFDDPERFQRRAFAQAKGLLDTSADEDRGNPARRFLHDVARSAKEGSALIRQAWADYSTPIDYGIAPMDLNKVAACIDAGLPTRVYYVAFRNNSFDTHVQQVDLHRRLLSYACDAIHGFLRDVERLGQAERVAVLAFSEFGRRVPENANLGTDHGAGNVMFLAGKPVKGGHYGTPPSLTALNPEDNLAPTVDFRRVYATAIDGWMAPGASNRVLNGRFEPLPVFG
ncbi:MAG: DUF1501 domain-containing protein [Gammaproteobacteria bacterium]|nr:DUF1501 domain-containing protein [Gammaproteobacteria bacterium]